MAKIFYYDTETTGLKHWKNGIHQISGAIEIDGEIKEYFNLKIQPYKDAIIEDEAIAISGITREQIGEYMTFSDGYRAVMAIIGKYVDRYNKKDRFFLCGYNNASFDNQFFRAFFVQNMDSYFGSYFWSSSIDVFILASQKLMHDRPNMIDFKQSTVAKHLGLEVDETKLHDAEYDVNLLIQIYKLIIT